MYLQAYRVCDWWSNVDCPTSEQLYANNEELYRDAEGNLIWGEAPLVRPRLAKLLDLQRHGRRHDHHQHHKDHYRLHQERRENEELFSHSSGRISGGTTLIAANQVVDASTNEEKTTTARVNTDLNQQELSIEDTQKDTRFKLFPSNDIINSNNLKSKFTNPKEALAKDLSTAGKAKEEAEKGEITRKSNLISGPNQKGSRGSKKFNLNVHDTDEVEFMKRGSTKDSVSYDSVTARTISTTTTTKRSSQTGDKIANKYNIDYDHMLEDEYEIIQKVE